MTGPKKGSRGRGPKKNTAQGRGGITRDTVKPARERPSERSTAERPPAERTTARGSEISTSGAGKTSGSRFSRSGGASGRSGAAARPGASTNPARRKPAERGDSEGAARPKKAGGGSSASPRPGGSSGSGRRPPPKVGRKPMPELKRVVLDAPAPDTVFRDRDGEPQSFPESNLKRVAARILSERNKAWRYRPFSFPLFTDKGNEQAFHFDFYVYDFEDSVIRLILVIPFESREVWDRVGRFKRQYPMYTYELWTPEKLAHLDGPRGRLEF
ncbi:hypothetical protein [Deinococcus koreensis]|uniref:Uncharacterized protein n=1 Tax=Deinococcus koreensis TaxID=2054903 RepID=A0A2K3UVB5_9DEIO|nr:hypothetical protein [Deinococcus koreensis]PNY80485.1 hypothetical protein CVO96_03075 [Deinococcus koreensis]